MNAAEEPRKSVYEKIEELTGAKGKLDEKALVDGDFAMLESEVQSVLKALRASGINIVAIHNHMTMENPGIIFLHYWGIGSTSDLARGFKAALDTQQK